MNKTTNEKKVAIEIENHEQQLKNGKRIKKRLMKEGGLRIINKFGFRGKRGHQSQ